MCVICRLRLPHCEAQNAADIQERTAAADYVIELAQELAEVKA